MTAYKLLASIRAGVTWKVINGQFPPIFMASAKQEKVVETHEKAILMSHECKRLIL